MMNGTGAFLYFAKEVNNSSNCGPIRITTVPAGSLGIVLYPSVLLANEDGGSGAKGFSCFVPAIKAWNNIETMVEQGDLVNCAMFLPQNTFAVFNLEVNGSEQTILLHPYVFDAEFSVLRGSNSSRRTKRIGIWSAKPEDFWGIKTKT